MVSAELLAKYGFLNEKGKEIFGNLPDDVRREKIDSYSGDVDKLANQEKWEEHIGVVSETGYPNSLSRQRLVYENYQMSIEEMYFWILNQITVDQGFKKDNVIKITDVFAASETSSYWGIHTQRLNIQQDRASQYLKFIADMIKTMFQLIRDLNIVDEKLGYYESSFSDNEDKAIDGEMILKGQYADLVEGGPKNPSSIFGMAQNYGFVTLPDLFFQSRPFGGRVKTEKELNHVLENIKKYVENQEFGNKQFKNILERKLSQFYRWKFKTYNQLKTYRKLYKSYLKQHYNNIRLYMNWVKPYLRNIRRLQPDRKKTLSPDLIAAFEGNLIEIEILAKTKLNSKHKYNAVVLVNWEYRTAPQLEWVPGHQERRSVMVGRAEMNIRAYAWTDEQVKQYREMKEAEDLELIGEIDSTIKEAMDQMEDQIKKYLEEKDDEKEEKKDEKQWDIKRGKWVEVKKKKKSSPSSNISAKGLFEPFLEVGRGFGMFLKPFSFKISGKMSNSGKKEAAGKAKITAWLLFKFYKKAHGLLSW